MDALAILVTEFGYLDPDGTNGYSLLCWQWSSSYDRLTQNFQVMFAAGPPCRHMMMGGEQRQRIQTAWARLMFGIRGLSNAEVRDE
jgi:hypothetical protein